MDTNFKVIDLTEIKPKSTALKADALTTGLSELLKHMDCGTGWESNGHHVCMEPYETTIRCGF